MVSSNLRSRLAAAFDLSANIKLLLRRAEHQPDHFAAVDGLRALSVLWVILFHVGNELGRALPRDDLVMRVVRRGFLGVDIFFVISGFLIGSLVLRERRDRGSFDVGRFYYRRALRILPTYWLVLAAYCATLGPNSHNVGWNLLFVNNFLPGSEQCMSWAWSLAVEEQFYLLFPGVVWLLYRIPERQRLMFLLTMFGLAFCVRAGVIYWSNLHVPSPMRDQLWTDTFMARTYARYGGLLCGVTMAHLLVSTDLVARLRRSLWRAPLLLATAVAIVDLSLRHSIFKYAWPAWANLAYLACATYLFCMAIAYVILASVADLPETRWLSRALRARWLYPIGQLSYASYLVHLLVIGALFDSRTLAPAQSLAELALQAALVTVATLGSAAAIYLVVERPIMNLRDVQRTVRPIEQPAGVGQAAA